MTWLCLLSCVEQFGGAAQVGLEGRYPWLRKPTPERSVPCLRSGSRYVSSCKSLGITIAVTRGDRRARCECLGRSDDAPKTPPSGRTFGRNFLRTRRRNHLRARRNDDVRARLGQAGTLVGLRLFQRGGRVNHVGLGDWYWLVGMRCRHDAISVSSRRKQFFEANWEVAGPHAGCVEHRVGHGRIDADVAEFA
jgi:hypothetical protein